MECDMESAGWLRDKIGQCEVYRQNLYAALCNNEFQRQDVFEVLRNSRWSCSWRYAGGIVSRLHGEGDYMNYYCSGMRDDSDPPVANAQGRHYVGESVVTDEIRGDLTRLGWSVVTDRSDDCG